MKLKESEKKKEEDGRRGRGDGRREADESEPVVAETDNVGDPSVEINVEELIHELEVDGVAACVPVASKLRSGGSKSSWRESARSAISRISTTTKSRSRSPRGQ